MVECAVRSTTIKRYMNAHVQKSFLGIIIEEMNFYLTIDEYMLHIKNTKTKKIKKMVDPY